MTNLLSDCQTNEEPRHKETKNQGIKKWMHEENTIKEGTETINFEQAAPTFIFWRFMPFVWLMPSSCEINFKETAWDVGLSSKSAQLLAQRGTLAPNCRKCQRPQKHELVAPAHASAARRSGKHCAHDDEHGFMVPSMLAGGPHNSHCQAEKFWTTMRARHFK